MAHSHALGHDPEHVTGTCSSWSKKSFYSGYLYISVLFVGWQLHLTQTNLQRLVKLCILITSSVVGYQPFINPTHGLATQILTTGLFISVDNPNKQPGLVKILVTTLF